MWAGANVEQAPPPLPPLMESPTAATISLKPEQAGALVTHDIPLDPRFFVDFNQLRLQWIAHYSNGCEDPLHSSLSPAP